MCVCALGSDEGGLNDRILVGGAAAFAADAGRWKALLENHIKLATPWVPETLHQATLRAAGISVRETMRAARTQPPCETHPHHACKKAVATSHPSAHAMR